ncbi:DUF1573 domain-containing protein [Candidatus Wolfebacteria bacterium]|nr:DUF1573 domain-containing protein [Candidatus Wolfebacteria bacterium]
MEKFTNQQIIAAILVIVLIIFGFSLFGVKNQLTRIENQIAHLDEEMDEAVSGVERLLKRKSPQPAQNIKTDKLPLVFIGETEYDFGKISKKNGIVTKEFTIANKGKSDLIIGDIVTSCGCTSAKIDKTVVAPDSSAVLTVNFDPNFHEEPQGRFSRSVFVPTNDPNNEEIEFKISVEIKN